MGLSLYYNWKIKADAAKARNLVQNFRTLALQLPFDSVSEIFEQDSPDGETTFEPYDHPFRQGDLYLPRKRADGEDELVIVPALHAVFFIAQVQGAESAIIGLASHPPVVQHREDIIERDDEGRNCGHIIGAGDPIEFPTRRRGIYSWHGFCKTQYADHPSLGGEANFLKAHLSLIELFDQMQATGVKLQLRDDSNYARHRNVDRLLRTLREWNGLIANFVGQIGDALGNEPGAVVAPIKDRPDFEHLEFKGIEVLKKLAERQRRRKRKKDKE